MALPVCVAVLGGGRSPEHDISCQSAREVLAHLDPTRWCGVPVFLDREGAWCPPIDEGWFDGSIRDAQRAFGIEPTRPMRPGEAVAHLLDRGVAVVFPVLHGRFGEDGTVQGMLELHDVPFVGSGTAASAVGMDKIRTREALRARGIPMAPAWFADSPLAGADPDAVLAALAAAGIGFPCFLKTDVSGSTLGVRRANGPDDVRSFLAEETARGTRFVVEGLVVGEEISVPVLGNSAEVELQPLTPIGIYPRSDQGFFTHVAKYEAGGADEVVPPRGLSEGQIASAKELACRCHRALWCDGISRTDMIWTADGPVVLEVNTIPGMSRASLVPKAAAADGIAFARLLDLLIESALRRASRGGTTA
jgi:D-alanine-D-alanine ligase